MMEVFQLIDDSEVPSPLTDSEGDQLFMTLSLDALTGSRSSKSFCL